VEGVEMSVWSEASGTVILDKTKHFSLKKYTTAMNEETFIFISQITDNIDEFSLRVCLDGDCAIKFFKDWMSGIAGKVDMTVQVRMMK
jgi:hypothetical protein